MTLLQTKIVDALRSGMRNVDVARKVGCSKSTVTYVKRQFMPALVVPCDEPPPPNYLAILKALKTGDPYKAARVSIIKSSQFRPTMSEVRQWG